MAKTRFADPLIVHAEHVLNKVYYPRILSCVRQLSTEQIWWRPNETSNSVGNLLLHLEGNVRQWIISGLGGSRDARQRELEFATRGPVPGRVLLRRLRKSVTEGCRVMRALSPQALDRVQTIQKFRVTGRQAAFHVAEHFAYHTGQIILLTKLLTGADLKLTHLPGDKGWKTRSLPAW